jgi:predicted nucleotidyltransferase
MDTQTRETLLQKKEIVTQQFKKTMQELYGDRLAKIVLYGSYARGDFHEESDIDFLVVLNDENVERYKEKVKIISKIESLEEQEDIFISALPMPLKRFTNIDSPLLYFISKEGILI